MVEFFDRQTFIGERWSHLWGEHVTILAPTGWGKSTLAFDLLAPLSTPQSPTVVLCMKRRDKTVTQFARKHGFRQVETWPPPANWRVWQPRKPAGYLVWPKITGDDQDDEYRQFMAFSAAIRAVRGRGKGTKIFVDELADMREIKDPRRAGAGGLDKAIKSALRQGRSEDAAIVGASQRPFNIPTEAYGQATHLFIGNDTDKNSRDRYGEIGGIDKNLLIDLTSSLDQFQWLYIRRARGTTKTRMCIVGA